jgi:hypothetical protein
MKYIFLTYDDEAHPARGTPERIAEYDAFTQSARAAGAMLDVSRLRPSDTATTVRVRNGDAATTDGPFAETKEQLAGYYILDCEDLDEALTYAMKIPAAETGAVEVRPVWET